VTFLLPAGKAAASRRTPKHGFSLTVTFLLPERAQVARSAPRGLRNPQSIMSFVLVKPSRPGIYAGPMMTENVWIPGENTAAPMKKGGRHCSVRPPNNQTNQPLSLNGFRVGKPKTPRFQSQNSVI
jgi:hypothetical protein